jgi:hypothetical protein
MNARSLSVADFSASAPPPDARARARNVAPKSVSGRVVKTATPASAAASPRKNLRALRAPDPVAQHRLDAVRPVERVEAGEQPSSA